LILKSNYNFSNEKLSLFLFFIHKYSDYMNGKLDLELYTISIIELNNALEHLKESEINDKIKTNFKNISNTFQELYDDIIKDLSLDEIQFNDYYLFFENGKRIFPHCIENLKQIKNKEIKDSMDSLINVFINLNKIAEAFPTQKEMIE